MRINKYISHNTDFSRREADKLIQEGKIKLNHSIVTDLSTTIKTGDKVFLQGNLIRERGDFFTVIVYNKPKGELVTKKDDRGRKIIYDSLPSKFRAFVPIGRLDYASEGLLLLTDSPNVASALMESNLERIYKVKVDGHIGEDVIKSMKEGLKLDNATKGGHKDSDILEMEFAPFVAFSIFKNERNYSKLKIALSEGKNREIRRFFAYFGLNVLDLNRVSFGGVGLNSLPVGKFRFLDKKEYSDLRNFLKSLS